MGHSGDIFRDKLTDYIESWEDSLEVLHEVNIGSRFVGTPRRLDIVIHNKQTDRFMAIECKTQLTSGTAYEKFSYALEDCIASPIPTILVFAGNFIRDDMKSKLIMSGKGLEMKFEVNDNGEVTKFEDTNNLVRQRCYIELGMNWFPFATGEKIKDQLEKLGY